VSIAELLRNKTHEGPRTKIDLMFRLISAGFAGPHVPNGMIGTMLRPDHARESGNELRTALRTLTEQYSIHRYFLHASTSF
jgi:hypothetical protein